MARPKLRVTEAPKPPARGVKASTWHLLLQTGMRLIREQGHIPSIAEVAARSSVSRATAYRYFPSRSALVTAVIDVSLGPVRTFRSGADDGRARIHELFAATFPRFSEFEPQMRAGVQLTLEHWALQRAGLLEEEPYRRGHRVRLLEHALAPFEASMPSRVHDRLHRALSLIYGIEPYMVFKDIWGVSDREVERIALWMTDALIDAALRDAAAVKPASRAARPNGGARMAAPTRSRSR